MADQNTAILFVDNDDKSLNKLQQLMDDEGWQCQFVSSGSAALELLGREQFDLLVSAVEMPEMSGLELFEQVLARYPYVVRISLTDGGDQQHVRRILSEGCAQQVIPKPWIDQEFKEVLRSAARQKKQQRRFSPELQTLLNSTPLLPALPESYSQIQSCAMDEEVDIEKMAGLIEQDVALSGALLHWANSALFSQRFHVDTVKKAIVVLGTSVVKHLILSEIVTNRMIGSQPLAEGFNLAQFKCHSVATATLTRLLLKSTHGSEVEVQDRGFIAGLLHDIGKLLAASSLRQSYSQVLCSAEQNNCAVVVAESEILQTTHAELGSFLAQWWTLPHFIVSAIELHHSPGANTLEPDIVYATTLANILSYRFGYGCTRVQPEVPSEQELYDRFYLTDEGLEILQVKTSEIVQALCPDCCPLKAT